jgi:hypothetical protein
MEFFLFTCHKLGTVVVLLLIVEYISWILWFINKHEI